MKRVIWNPWQINEELKFMKNQALELHSPLPKSFKVCKERSKERGKTEWRKQRKASCSLLLHFWNTSRSPFSTLYIPFQSSGSQESNASNSAWFGVEMKELHPLEANHSKLKEEFCTATKSPFCCEMISQPFCTVLWNSPKSFLIVATRWKLNTASWNPTSQRCKISLLLRSDFAALFVRLRNLADLVFTCEMVLSASRYLWPKLWDIFLQIFLYEFPFFSL